LREAARADLIDAFTAFRFEPTDILTWGSGTRGEQQARHGGTDGEHGAQAHMPDDEVVLAGRRLVVLRVLDADRGWTETRCSRGSSCVPIGDFARLQ
jgi:hypothetical protein